MGEMLAARGTHHVRCLVLLVGRPQDQISDLEVQPAAPRNGAGPGDSWRKDVPRPRRSGRPGRARRSGRDDYGVGAVAALGLRQTPGWPDHP